MKIRKDKMSIVTIDGETVPYRDIKKINPFTIKDLEVKASTQERVDTIYTIFGMTLPEVKEASL